MSDQQQQEINLEVARALGRIEAGIERVLAEQQRVSTELVQHTKQDQENFVAIEKSIATIKGSKAVALKWGALAGGLLAGAAEAMKAFAG